MTLALRVDLSDRLLHLLRTKAVGRENAIPSRELAGRLEIQERAVRSVVHDLRCSGVAVGSAVEPPFGFYLPRDKQEADICSRQLWARVTQIAKVAREFDRAAAGIGLHRPKAEQVRMVFGEDTPCKRADFNR